MPPPVESNTETLSLWSFLADPIGFLSDVEHGGTHLILTLDGKPIGAVIPLSDLKKLQHNTERSEP